MTKRSDFGISETPSGFEVVWWTVVRGRCLVVWEGWWVGVSGGGV